MSILGKLKKLERTLTGGKHKHSRRKRHHAKHRSKSGRFKKR